MPYEQTVGGADFGFLAANFFGDVQTFFANNNATSAGSQRWVKPRGVTMCYMTVISGGGGGGGGATGATTTARGGGGGGAPGNISKLIIPTLFVPDVLQIIVGQGGAGGGAGAVGGLGTNSIISYGVGLTALATIPNLFLAALSSNQTAAGAGTASTGGAGGIVGGTETAASLGAAQTYMVPFFLSGANGGSGGAQTGAAGGNVNSTWSAISVSGGGGGAGVNTVNTGFAGGTIALSSGLDHAEGSLVSGVMTGGTAGGAGAAGNGNAGIQLFKPFYMTGGTGGGSSDKAAGGNGGQGGIGCGGGGGGGGTTGGTGGNGGDGCVIIISW